MCGVEEVTGFQLSYSYSADSKAYILNLAAHSPFAIRSCNGSLSFCFLYLLLFSLGFSLTDLSEYLDIAIMLDIVSCWVLDVEPGIQLGYVGQNGKAYNPGTIADV
jgi:hypothetical protein